MSLLSKIKLFFVFLIFFHAVVAAQVYTDTMLIHAVKHNSISLTKELIKSGSNVNARDSNLATPLMWAAYEGDLYLFKYLVAHEADFNLKGVIYIDSIGTYYGNILGILASRNDTTLLKYCLDSLHLNVDDREYNPISKKDDGWTPACWSIADGSGESLELLINHHANLDSVTDKNGNSALLYAAIHCHYQILNYILNLNTVDINQKNLDGWQLVHYLSRDVDDNKWIDKIVEQGAELNEKTNDELTPLMLAALNNRIYTIIALLLNGANPIIKDSIGENAARIAFKNQHYVASLIINRSTTTNLKENLRPFLDSINLEIRLQHAAENCNSNNDYQEALRYYKSELQLTSALYGVKHPLYAECLKNITSLIRLKQPDSLRLILPEGHLGTINNIDFCWDGSYIVSSSLDHTAKLWDVQSGKLVYTFKGAGPLTSATFSNDAKKIFTTGADDNPVMWDAITGNKLMKFQGQFSANGYCDATFSNDDKFILVPNLGFVTVFKTDSGTIFKKLGYNTYIDLSNDELCENCKRSFAKYSPDNRYIFTASFADSAISVWDAVSFEKIRELGIHHAQITSLQIVNDSWILITEDSSSKLWNFKTGDLVGDFNVPGNKVISSSISPDAKFLVLSSSDSSIIFYDLGKSKTIRIVKNESGIVSKIVFNPNGKIIATADSGKYISLWNVERGNIINYDELGYLTTALKFSPDGNKLAVGNGGNIYIFNAVDLSLLNTLTTDAFQTRLLSINKSGNYFITTALASDDALRVWNLKQGVLEEDILNHKDYINQSEYSPDEKLLFTVSNDSTIKVWNTDKWNCISTYRCTEVPKTFQISGNGKLIAIAFYSGIIRLLTADSLKTISEIKIEKGLDKIRFCLSDSILLFSNRDGYFGAIDVNNISIVFKTKFDESRFRFNNTDIDVNADGNYFLFSYDGSGAIYSAKTLKVVNSFDYTASGIPVACVAFGASYQSILVLYSDDRLIIADETGSDLLIDGDKSEHASGNIAYSINGTVSTPIVLSPDKRFIIVLNDSLTVFDCINKKIVFKTFAENFMLSGNGKILIYDDYSQIFAFSLETLKTIIKFISMNNYDKGYVAITDEGFYQGNKDCMKKLSYGSRNIVYDFSQFDIQYNRPDKVLSTINNVFKDSNNTVLEKLYKKAYTKRITKLAIDTLSSRKKDIPVCEVINSSELFSVQDSFNITLHIMAYDSLSPLKLFNIVINDVPLFGKNGIELHKRNDDLFDTSISIELTDGKNIIRPYVINEDGTESTTSPMTVNASGKIDYYYDTYSDSLNFAPIQIKFEQSQKVYFIGIGVDKYRQKEHNLLWSLKDVRDIALHLKEKYKNAVQIDTLFNENVTVSNVKALKIKLEKTSVNDKVIIAYSGHGLLSKDYDYYLSTYNTNFQQPEQNGLPYDELEDLLDSIPARKKLMLIDACHSGEIDKDEMQQYAIVKSKLDSSGIHRGVELINKDSSKIGMKNSFELMKELFVDVSKNTGATIISAAAGTQFAMEKSNLKNGVFTYSILEYMQQHAHASISALKQYVNTRVPELTQGLQQPTSRSETIDVDWDVW